MPYPRQGEVYFWPAIPANHPMGSKTRRWVVVSCDRYNQHSDSVLACPVTSHPPDPLDVAVSRTPHNGLDHDSAMVCDLVSPILQDELTSPVGRVSFDIVEQVLDRLRMIVYGK
ncbi:MAG: type II toxin-antitoxin system PemK/MazF family toxin [Planctomycetes bacterium]|nr:type II toxin-antitoxin system PemK/MazF family toxin [Planctomycetota bacterium]